ncbi:DUF4365 domain-containing protein [Flavobacterium sp. J372]|uniref:DUF4365 domain-containing protein n=1 Tax=Flavobacterium sp. J372 TaxID=2898436 RepID=UPI002151CBD6|nr:DUF4365 domain-containing protein [Flavobacterium sp. J372]MCR5860984.1 DUF4365 domain-containing protein [Flavobacterium sp. J372]
MRKIFNSKPAKFPNNTTEEQNSVYKLLDILDKNRIKPDPKLIDKFPNTDGEITVVDEEQFPIGKCEIQIKTLPDSDITSPSHQCDLPFLSYCESSLLPIILIIVNAKNEIAFWKHIDRETLKELAKKIKGKSIVLHIPLNNKVTRSDNSYVEEWIKIVESYIQKKINSEVQEEYEKKYKELQKIIDEYPKPVHSIGSESLKAINIFIDTLNNALDGDFISIKEVAFYGYWKISIAYTDFSDKKLSFAIIPIKYGDNDLLIREVKSMNPLIRSRFTRNVISHYTNNPIKHEPVEYAYSLIKKETIEILENKSLQLICYQLAIEYITDFYDYSKEILPVKFQNEFDVNYMFKIVNFYLPIWAEEFYSINKNVSLDDKIYFNIEDAFWYASAKDRKKVTDKAISRYNKNEYCIKEIIYTSSEFANDYILDSLKLLLSRSIQSFERPFCPKIYNASKFIWDWYSPQNAFEKLKFIFNELPKVYDLFLETYFPRLLHDLKYYSDTNLIIININYKNKFDSFDDSPSIEFYYFKTEQNIIPRTSIYLNSEDCPIKRSDISMRQEFDIDGVKYNMTSASWGVINYLDDNFSLQKYLYKLLKEKFEKYFKLKTSNN